MFTRPRVEDMSFRDVKIKIPDRIVTWGCEWRHAPEVCAVDYGVFEKNQLIGFLARKKAADFRGTPKPGQWPCGRCHTWFGADRKVSI